MGRSNGHLHASIYRQLRSGICIICISHSNSAIYLQHRSEWTFIFTGSRSAAAFWHHGGIRVQQKT